MTDKKFTDEEIVRNYEWCIGCTSDRCRECTMDEQGFCEEELQDLVLDLINRQKSEIERLKTENKIYIDANQVIGYQRDQRDKEIDELQKQIDGLDVRENKIKAEAYKEFAERLKKETLSDRGYDILQQGTIDNILKEMVGEEE